MIRKKSYNVAIVGATGAVGTEMLRVLEQRRFPIKRLRLLASRRSAGRRIAYNGSRHTVEVLQRRSFDGIDVALFSAGASRSLEYAPEAVRRGAITVDNSSAFRLDRRVPLVVPEVNPAALAHHAGLIANPNCSTIIMLLAVAPLHRAARVKRIIVSTYQSVSGAGIRAMVQLMRETQAVLRSNRVLRTAYSVNPRLAPRTLHHSPSLPGQIAFNVIPQIDQILRDGSTKEEMKMVRETRKILRCPGLAVSATCVRVPVFVGHAEAVWIETGHPLAPSRARALLRRAPGVRFVDRPGAGGYPLPLDCAGRQEVLVGRVRKDPSVRNGIALWVCGDNLLKGAATNAVQIAELAVKQ